MEPCRTTDPGKPTTRRFSQAAKNGAVRAVCQMHKELGTEHGTVKRVADQLGFGMETVRKRVTETDIDYASEAGRLAKYEEQIRDLTQRNG